MTNPARAVDNGDTSAAPASRAVDGLGCSGPNPSTSPNVLRTPRSGAWASVPTSHVGKHGIKLGARRLHLGIDRILRGLVFGDYHRPKGATRVHECNASFISTVG